MNLIKKICGQILKISRKTLFHTHKSMIIIKFLDNMKTTIVFGTRPEIIKLAPLIKTLNKKSTSLIFNICPQIFLIKFIKDSIMDKLT